MTFSKATKEANGPATERAEGSGVRRDVWRALARRVYVCEKCCFSFCLVSCHRWVPVPPPTRISVVPPYMSNNCRNIVTLNIHRYTFISIFIDSIGYCVALQKYNKKH